jgi:uncharacterized protein YgbK (DUF1537 family)
VVLDPGTRDHPPGEARARVVAAVRALGPAVRPRLWIRRVDTTLRGPVAPEAQALLDLLGLDRAVAVPAHPSAGRTTSAGRQRVDQLEEDLDVVDAMPASLECLRGGPEPPATGQCWVPDVGDDADLVRVARVVASEVLAGRPALVLDAGPFGAALASHLLERDAQPIVVAIGSSSEVSARQVAVLRAAGRPGVTVLHRAVLGPADPALDDLAYDAAAHLRRARGAVVGGGLTAERVLAAAGADRLEPLGLLAPLVSLVRAEVHGRPTLVAMKGGLVGGPRSLVDTVDALTGRLIDEPRRS